MSRSTQTFHLATRFYSAEAIRDAEEQFRPFLVVDTNVDDDECIRVKLSPLADGPADSVYAFLNYVLAASLEKELSVEI